MDDSISAVLAGNDDDIWLYRLQEFLAHVWEAHALSSFAGDEPRGREDPGDSHAIIVVRCWFWSNLLRLRIAFARLSPSILSFFLSFFLPLISSHYLDLSHSLLNLILLLFSVSLFFSSSMTILFLNHLCLICFYTLSRCLHISSRV